MDSRVRFFMDLMWRSGVTKGSIPRTGKQAASQISDTNSSGSRWSDGFSLSGLRLSPTAGSYVVATISARRAEGH